jgi:hypothetical protein
MKAKKPGNVFISHARVDAPRLKEIVRRLVASGVISEEDRIFKEEDLPATHGSLREEVKRRIQAASQFVVTLGRRQRIAMGELFETALADALGKPIIARAPGRCGRGRQTRRTQAVKA